jgi:hypothetical protein
MKKVLWTAGFVCVLACAGEGADSWFLRGDVNQDGDWNIGDPIAELSVLFASGTTTCDASLDVNDDGDTNIADAVYLLAYLFANGQDPKAPFDTCGPDPTPDAPPLTCVSFDSCAALPPICSGSAPATGPAAGGTVITITGQNLSGPNTKAFVCDVALLNLVVDSDTQIHGTTPAGDYGQGCDVRVTTDSGECTAGAFTYESNPAPICSDIVPTTGPAAGGTSVTITGQNLSGVNAKAYVCGKALLNLVVDSDTQVHGTTPAGTYGQVCVVKVTTDDGECTLTDAFTYGGRPAPDVTGVSPSAGPREGGTAITITGTNLNWTGTQATLCGRPIVDLAIVNETTITGKTPAGSYGEVCALFLSNDAGSDTLAGAFTYGGRPKPDVTGVSPSGGPREGGTAITITGTNLNWTGTQATLCGRPIVDLAIVNETTITGKTPAGSYGEVCALFLSNDAGNDTLLSAFTYDPASGPRVDGIAPGNGTYKGGTPVVITGEFFSAAGVTATICDAALDNLVVTDTEIQGTTPAATSSATCDVTVTTVAGSDTLENGFTYDAPVCMTADDLEQLIQDQMASATCLVAGSMEPIETDLNGTLLSITVCPLFSSPPIMVPPAMCGDQPGCQIAPSFTLTLDIPAGKVALAMAVQAVLTVHIENAETGATFADCKLNITAAGSASLDIATVPGAWAGMVRVTALDNLAFVIDSVTATSLGGTFLLCPILASQAGELLQPLQDMLNGDMGAQLLEELRTQLVGEYLCN